MAIISTPAGEKVFRITSWHGLNENPDGDTKLRLGEAAKMRNFRVTRDGNLQRRPGSTMIAGLMRAYTLFVSPEAEAVRRDTGLSSQLTMYPQAAAMSNGTISLSGQAEVVSYENAEVHAGWYWSYRPGKVWQLSHCQYDSQENVYTWYFYAVTARSASQNSRVAGLWSGNVGGMECLVGACDGRLWLLHNGTDFIKNDIGSVDTSTPVFMFGYSEKLYIMNGKQYLEWDGQTYREVIGYRPLVAVSVPPAGGGTTLEQINKLNGLRRCWFSPTGQAATFQLPETGIASVDYVKDLGTGIVYEAETDYSVDLINGKVTFIMTGTETAAGDGTKKSFVLTNHGISSFSSVTINGTETTEYTYTFATHSIEFATAPPAGAEIVFNLNLCPQEGTNSLEIGWTYPTNFRSQVEAMKYAEIFNGATDNRVFIYGDGSNHVFYSGLDYDGNPRADYFPDLNVLHIGEANTPVTALIRHYSRLICYKTNSAYSVQYGAITLEDGTVTAAFYSTPVNRTIGNIAPGQVRLVLNSPYTLHGKDVYEWKNNSSYSSNLSVDERQAKRVSDRIASTLSGFNLADCYCWDDNDAQEYYICYGGRALVYNYASDAWYAYTDLDVTCMVNMGGELYFGDSQGRLNHFSYQYRTDNGRAIDAYWESGSMAFDAAHLQKYSTGLWVGIKPESRSAVSVSALTDSKADFAEHEVASSLATFLDMNFAAFSFATNRQPHMHRLKIKAKKFVFYKLIFETVGTDATATILAAEIRVRFTGFAK